MNLGDLRVQPRQPIKSGQHNGLVDLAEQGQIQRGRLKGRQTPDGFTPVIDVSATTVVDHPFAVSVGDGDGDTVLVTVTPGHVSGIVPTIAGIDLFDVDGSGNPPQLHVGAGAWKKRGLTERALIMLRYQLRESDSSVESAEVIAVSAPQNAPYQWSKLIALLVRVDGAVRVCQQAFFPQAFNVADAAGGRFHPFPQAVP